MGGPERSQRLVDLIAEARGLLSAAPTPCRLLRVLDALTDEEVAELGARHLNRDRHAGILGRLTQALGIEHVTVWNVLTRSLAADLEDYSPWYDAARRAYDQAGRPEVEARGWLRHHPPESVAFVWHAQVYRWRATDEARGAGLGLGRCLDEDGRRSEVCAGYLVAAGLAFPTTVALLRASMGQGWRDWCRLWGYF